MSFFSRRRLGLVLCLGLAVSAASCRERKLQDQGCQKDSDCGEPALAYRCETQTGTCYCRTNQACKPSEFCNTLGFCQDKAGCEKNSDCDVSQFCDTTSGSCLSKGRCTADLHCALGQVCDLAKTTCVDGCRTDGDCAGSSCRCNDGPCTCTGTTPAELAKCQVGTCDPNFCSNETFCKFGEQCGVQPDAGSTLKQCYSDYSPTRRPYCDTCQYGAGISTCGKGPNYCLIDTANPGNSFCGADCSEGQQCPRGYSCSDVIVVLRQWRCTRANPACPVNPNKTCTTDAQCPRGGTCVKAAGATSGNCAPKCAIDEGDDEGYCSCLVDEDCAQETCSAGECSVSRRSCVNDMDCRTIRCIDFNGAGGCFIGQNCAPADGLSCLDVK